MTRVSAKTLFMDLASGMSDVGYQREPFSIGPTGMGVLRIELSPEVSGYANFAFYTKYQAVGIALGFGFPGLKRVTDACLRAVGREHGIVPMYSTANPCPAVLFPLENFVGQKEGLPIAVGTGFVDSVRKVIHEQVFAGNYSWINSRVKLCEFLVNNKPPFGWLSGEVPRRLCQVAYLLSLQRVPFDEARTLLSPAGAGLQGDADFEGYRGDLILDVLKYCYSTPNLSTESAISI
jgi:hypothetical protein